MDGDPTTRDSTPAGPQPLTPTPQAHDPHSFSPTVTARDLQQLAEGTHPRLHECLGAHPRTVAGCDGVSFAVWAPNARSVRVAGSFNDWDGSDHPMRRLDRGGIWELFVPNPPNPVSYNFEVMTAAGNLVLKTDPVAFATEAPPSRASLFFDSAYQFGDEDWLDRRKTVDPHTSPLSIYEVHLGSWRRDDRRRSLNYHELSSVLVEYCTLMGFTHVEFLPVAEHPFRGSWGYQVSNYFAPTARLGDPDGFRLLVDSFHQAGIGVIVDWVPAHFPKDEWGLARFDGTPLYEDPDPRKGAHPDWGTLIFDYGRKQVRNFLISNALYWIEQFHIDGFRVDAVASMLYLDYSRKKGEWAPNKLGGRENLEAVQFLEELNATLDATHPDVLMIAEESTAWPGVTKPVRLGGLGFDFKWNLGWMHDTLSHFSKDPLRRRVDNDELTFTLMYAWSERYILPLSHDEVVHGKSSLLGRMPGDKHQRLATLKCLLSYMWAYAGKKLLFMGGELGQEREWDHDSSIDWSLLDDPGHAGVARFVADLNRAYRHSPELWERDASPEGLRWTAEDDAHNNVLSFFRTGARSHESLVCIINLAPVLRRDFRIAMPRTGSFVEVLNTDGEAYGGSDVRNPGTIVATGEPAQGLGQSAVVTLPPLAGVWLRG
jgi:1,4-alpha-glucan branching enzyme